MVYFLFSSWKWCSCRVDYKTVFSCFHHLTMKNTVQQRILENSVFSCFSCFSRYPWNLVFGVISWKTVYFLVFTVAPNIRRIMDDSGDMRDYSSVHEYCVYYFVCTKYGGVTMAATKTRPSWNHGFMISRRIFLFSGKNATEVRITNTLYVVILVSCRWYAVSAIIIPSWRELRVKTSSILLSSSHVGQLAHSLGSVASSVEYIALFANRGCMRSGSYPATTPALQDELRTSWSQVRSARHALQDVLRASWSHALSRCAGSGTVVLRLLCKICCAYLGRILRPARHRFACGCVYWWSAPRSARIEIGGSCC